jgi:very-short-patch-repair endonuclease
MPRAEFVFWSAVRDRQFEGLKFRRQHPIDRFFADFACPSAKLVVELDGPSHADREIEDAERTAVMERCGWRVIRFTNEEVLQGLEYVFARLLGELRLASR